MHVFFISPVCLENYSHSQNWGFVGVDPLNGEAYQRNPKRHMLVGKDVI